MVGACLLAVIFAICPTAGSMPVVFAICPTAGSTPVVFAICPMSFPFAPRQAARLLAVVFAICPTAGMELDSAAVVLQNPIGQGSLPQSLYTARTHARTHAHA
jgi:hypothetical protein